MNIDTIYHSLLERSFNNDTADQFTELTEKYPYCQALHFARLKWIKENKQVEYNDYLKHVAAYAGDREYLYSLINDKVPSIDVKNSSDQFQIVQPEIKKEVGPGPAIIDDGEDRLQQIIDQRLRELNLVRSAPSPEFKIDDFMLQFEEPKQEAETAMQETEIDLEMEVNEMEIYKQQEMSAPISIEEPVESIASVEEPVEFVEINNQEVESVEINNRETEPVLPEISKRDTEPALTEIHEPIATLAETAPFEEIEKLVQSEDPIDQLIGKNVIQEQYTPVATQLEEGFFEPAEQGPRSFTEWLRVIRLPLGVESINVSSVPRPKNGIIEKFIREEPRISPAKSTFYSPGNMARQSITEHDDLVSETLAKIYSTQGNYEKAISTFEKLSLQHPEKSAYFAALILDLKKKQNP